MNQCITEFVSFCSEAFAPRDFSPRLTFYHKSKYKPGALHKSLRKALGNEPLYGGSKKTSLDYTTQVAVTATSITGDSGLLLANYVRHEENEPPYKFTFPHNLQVWEAACATSAAPKYFSAFKQTCYPFTQFFDGALYHNNPASVGNHERKVLWPDVAENPPDILLSLGTGIHSAKLMPQIEAYDPSLIRQQEMLRSNNTELAKSRQKKRKALKGTGGFFKPKFFKALVCILS